ncbi:hypothetical protein ACLOJK_033256 [Asimina triloba]
MTGLSVPIDAGTEVVLKLIYEHVAQGRMLVTLPEKASIAGCVPQGSRDLKELEGISIIGVQQIDRVVEVVEETLKGHEVRLLNRKTLPALDLPKVRKNKFIEILPINVGCLGACTYCKTKHARGHLGSYTVNSLVERVRTVISEGVKEIWLSSEDTGAYGRDIGVNLPLLLNAIVAELPPDGSTILRVGMTNPPFILEHLKEIAKILCHPCVYSFLHVPVQSGSDSILNAMNREYTVNEFRTVVDTLNQLVPEMQIATDIICGFPGETDNDFAQTVSLIKEYKFPQVHISQFYPRPGTPAARMKKVPSTDVKKRSRELTSIFESFTPYEGMEGQIERIWITEIATDGIHLVLVIAPESMLGTSTYVKITSVGRWSVFGEVVETPKHIKEDTANRMQVPIGCFPSANSGASFPCSKELECCACDEQGCGGETRGSDCCKSPDFSAENESDSILSNMHAKERNGSRLLGSLGATLLRRGKTHRTQTLEAGHALQAQGKQGKATDTSKFSAFDWVLVGGMIASFLMILALLLFK